MVKHSLRNMIEKYPYFFDKRPVSNFYKITKVYNKNFQLIYNDLFKTYESFHLNKRLNIWKEQDAPYEYKMNFVTSFPSLKSVKIYKNNHLIYKEDYSEEEEKDYFEYVYSAKYSVNNVLELYAYKCYSCGQLYFGDTLPVACSCGETKYVPVEAYVCSECGEIYFSSEEINDCTLNNHEDTLQKVSIYKCRNCGEVYFGVKPPEECSNCYQDENNTIHTKLDNSSITGVLNANDNYILEDNSVDYTDYGEYNLKVIVKDSKDNYVPNVSISLSNSNNIYGDYTNENGVVIIKNIVEDEYTLDVVCRGYENYSTTINIPDCIQTYETTPIIINEYEEDNTDYDSYNLNVSKIPEDKFIMVVETYEEYELIKGFPENDYTLMEYNQLLNENKIIPDVFDHDYSLDMIGALNNIPRKQYRVIDNDSEYPYTEPPFNNSTTEDDYHYIKRMIEYNLRLWCIKEEIYNTEEYDSRDFIEWFNPVTLELWKIYGIESQLINRERYLLKVFDENKHPFDENTGLVKCWTPEKWEHKDKFCDGSSAYGEYLFVNSSTVRPIPNENVDFDLMVLNSLGEPVTEDIKVDVYKVLENGSRLPLSNKPVTDNRFRVSYKSIDLDKPTVILFDAKYTNDLRLGTCKVVLNVRNTPDWYVDETKNEEGYVGDGSLEKPFNTLQEALNNVNSSLNYVGLLSDVTLKKPLVITQNTIIKGIDKFTNPNDITTRTVPKIYQKGAVRIEDGSLQYRRDFFKLVGNKNCKLILSNLRLISGQLNTYVGIRYWLNTNGALDIFETVIISGGTINIKVSTNQEKYYPFDFIDCEIELSKKDGAVLRDNVVEVYYDNQLIESLITDEDGKCSFKYHLNEYDVGEYTLHIKNKSNVFFESDTPNVIDATNNPHYYHPFKNEDVELSFDKYEIGDEFDLFNEDGTVFDHIKITENSDLTYTIEDFSFGKKILYSTLDNENDSSVEEEWFIESYCPLTAIKNQEFITNLIFNELTGEIKYDTITLSENPTLGELDRVIVGFDLINDNKDISVARFNVSQDKLNATNVVYTDAIILKEAITSLTFDDTTGVLTINKLGEFW